MTIIIASYKQSKRIREKDLPVRSIWSNSWIESEVGTNSLHLLPCNPISYIPSYKILYCISNTKL